MLIGVPKRMVAAGIDRFLACMFRNNGEIVARELEIDFTRLESIEPAGVASLANAIEYALSKGCAVTLKKPSVISDSVAYLDDCGLFQRYAGAALRLNAQLDKMAAPLQCVQHRDSHQWIQSKFSYWLAGQLGHPPAALGSMHACMKEIFNNIDNHSGIVVGCTHMQHFPARNEIVIAVSDFGIGIPTAMRRKFSDYVDTQALLHAIASGVTSKSTPGNQGVGLDFLINVVVKVNGGSVAIHSGNGKLACKMTSKTTRCTTRIVNAFYPGTMIEIRLNTATFVPDEMERETLEW